jgi:hypothetical protein
MLHVMFRLFRRTAPSPLSKPCSGCGTPARFGYGQHAEEDLQNLRPLCVNCLGGRLTVDYREFEGRAVVVQPAAGPPVYVFQPVDDWSKHFPPSGIVADVDAMLGEMNKQCEDCGRNANYVWVESQGLTADNFGKVLEKGISATLLKNNPVPRSLCATCCVGRITNTLKAKELSFIEFTSPRGSAHGFVLPMAY